MHGELIGSGRVLEKSGLEKDVSIRVQQSFTTEGRKPRF
jgi:hypothetical protein